MVKGFRIHTVFRRSLHGDVVELGETVEIGNILSGIIARQGGKHLCGRHSRLFAFRGINIHPVLWIVCGKGGIDFAYFWSLRQGFDKLVRLFLESGDVSTRLVLQVEFKAVPHAISGYHRGRHGKHRGIGNIGGGGINLSDDIIDRLPLSLALLPVFECHEIHRLRRAGAAERETGDRTAVFNLIDTVETAVDTLHHLTCLSHGRAGLRVHAHHDRPGILFGNKSRLRDIDQQHQQPERDAYNAPQQPPAVDNEHHPTYIASAQTLKNSIERFSETGCKIVLGVAVLVDIGFQ